MTLLIVDIREAIMQDDRSSASGESLQVPRGALGREVLFMPEAVMESTKVGCLEICYHIPCLLKTHRKEQLFFSIKSCRLCTLTSDGGLTQSCEEVWHLRSTQDKGQRTRGLLGLNSERIDLIKNAVGQVHREATSIAIIHPAGFHSLIVQKDDDVPVGLEKPLKHRKRSSCG